MLFGGASRQRLAAGADENRLALAFRVFYITHVFAACKMVILWRVSHKTDKNRPRAAGHRDLSVLTGSFRAILRKKMVTGASLRPFFILVYPKNPTLKTAAGT